MSGVSLEYSINGVDYNPMSFTAIAEGAQPLRFVPPGNWTWSFAGVCYRTQEEAIEAERRGEVGESYHSADYMESQPEQCLPGGE